MYPLQQELAYQVMYSAIMANFLSV